MTYSCRVTSQQLSAWKARTLDIVPNINTHAICITSNNNPGSKRSSDPNRHRRLQNTIPGIDDSIKSDPLNTTTAIKSQQLKRHQRDSSGRKRRDDGASHLHDSFELVATKLLSASFPSNPKTICLLDREMQQFPLWRIDQLRPQIHPSRGNNDAVGVDGLDGVRRSPSSFFSTINGRLHFVRSISTKSIKNHA